ncbi:hypothetical protein [Sinorhizobium medicae]
MTDLASGTITIKKDVVAGVFIAAFAIGFGAIAWNYSFGNVSQNGAGIFPAYPFGRPRLSRTGRRR